MIKNVIVIVSDSLSGMHTSMSGYKRDTTPFINSYFSKNGFVYTNARSNASWTLPSFSSFLRSRLASEIKVGELLHEEGTLPKIVGDHGVDVVSFLKEPTYSILESIHNAFVGQEIHTYTYDDVETPFQDASSWITSRTAPSPFFLFIHDVTPHNPYTPPTKYRTLFGASGTEVESGPRSTRVYLQGLCGNNIPQDEKERLALLYDQQVRYLDDLVKAFITSIPAAVLQETAIIFTADHGDEFGSHHNIFNHGYSLYEEVVRVPLCVYLPGAKPATSTRAVSLLDLTPTVLSLFGIKQPTSCKGVTLPELQNTEQVARTICIEGNRIIPFNVRASLRDIDNEAAEKRLLGSPDETALIKNNTKYYVTRHRGEEIYDVAADPWEKQNMIGSLDSVPEKTRTDVDELRGELLNTSFPQHFLKYGTLEKRVNSILQHNQSATREFQFVLNQFLRDQIFCQKLTLFIDQYPFFVPPYLELLEVLEGTSSNREYAKFLAYTFKRLQNLITSPTILEKVLTEYNYLELLSLHKLLIRFEKGLKHSLLMRFMLMRTRDRVGDFLNNATPAKPKKHLSVIQHDIDVAAFRKELSGKEHFWYTSTERQRRLFYHKDTQSIFLRVTVNQSEVPIPVDGQHESVRTPFTPHFFRIHRFIEHFAYESNCGLGRVAIIRLAPHKIAYRHTDTELWLRKRTRHHLVIDAKPGNLLLSGSDMLFPENGQLLKYGNKVMHKSYNDSDDWRVHVVFDMFPLDKAENDEPATA